MGTVYFSKIMEIVLTFSDKILSEGSFSQSYNFLKVGPGVEANSFGSATFKTAL
jgi:hypothetical protein